MQNKSDLDNTVPCSVQRRHDVVDFGREDLTPLILKLPLPATVG